MLLKQEGGANKQSLEPQSSRSREEGWQFSWKMSMQFISSVWIFYLEPPRFNLEEGKGYCNYQN